MPVVTIWLAYVLRLSSGILAIQTHDLHVTPNKAAQYAAAAAYYGALSGEDPFEMIGVARNESDFIEDLKGPDGKDCGITQTRITGSKYTCSQLRHDYRIGFKEVARELSAYRKSCRYAPDYDRCRFNRYNSGIKYSKTGEHGAYYLRVMCFADAARAGVDPGDSCRKVKSRTQIAKLLERSKQRPVASLEPKRRRG